MSVSLLFIQWADHLKKIKNVWAAWSEFTYDKFIYISSCISIKHLWIMNKFKNPTTGRFFINNNDHKQILHKQKFFCQTR